MPPVIPIRHYRSYKNQSNTAAIRYYYSMLMCSVRMHARSTLISSKYFCKNKTHGTVKYRSTIRNYAEHKQYTHPAGGLVAPDRNWTTSILTAATLIYTIGAGITAAAGTRLALQLILITHVEVGSFQLQDMYALYCYLLSLPPCVRIG